MAHTYSENREQKKPGEQERWTCLECHREWISAFQFGPNWTQEPWNEKNCIACGSPEIGKVRFKGLFDSTTPPDAMAQVLAQVGAEQLEEEAKRRARLSGGIDTSNPPATLMPEAYDQLSPLGQAIADAVMSGDLDESNALYVMPPERTFAPEFG